MSIRLARHDDLPRYAIVERAAAALYAPWGLDGALAASTTDTERVAAAIARGDLVAATDGDVMIGYALLDVDGSDLHLEELAVTPSHGRRGHGSALVAATIGIASERGCTRVTLVTLDFVPFGKAFYERRGFAVAGADALTPRLHELAPPDANDGRVVMIRAITAPA